MPKGGARPGAGRPFGRRDTMPRTSRARALQEEVTQFLKTNSACIFDGDSLALAITIYKNENLPIGMRMLAMQCALPFERPRLVASASLVQHINGDKGEDYSEKILAELSRIRAARAAEATEQSPQSPPNMPNVPQSNGVVESVPQLWREVRMARATRVIFTDPGRAWLIGGTRYQADEHGEIEVSNVLDEADLLKAGCRAER